MAKEMEPSAIQMNEQDRIKSGTFAFLDEYRGRRVNQYTGARGGRHYEVEGYQFDFASVTSITGIVNKFGIPDYYKRKGIEKAIDIMSQPGAQERLALSATLKNERARKHKNNTWQTELYEEAKSGHRMRWTSPLTSATTATTLSNKLFYPKWTRPIQTLRDFFKM